MIHPKHNRNERATYPSKQTPQGTEQYTNSSTRRALYYDKGERKRNQRKEGRGTETNPGKNSTFKRLAATQEVKSLWENKAREASGLAKVSSKGCQRAIDDISKPLIKMQSATSSKFVDAGNVFMGRITP